MFLSGDASKLKTKTFASTSAPDTSSPEWSQAMNRVAGNISVKILGQGSLGSGFIVLRNRQKYTVITNQHVLRAGETPYSVQTADGKIYSAKVTSLSPALKHKYDLAVLEFESNAAYPIAKIGRSLYLSVGEAIYAAGFPYSELEKNFSSPVFRQPQAKNPTSNLPGFVLKSGRITIVLNKALEEGYQIGYTNDVKKGMSGGPLLNSRGEVVGINGKHAYPLWESPEIYQDGSQPCAALQELITRSSLAIPIEKSRELASQLHSLGQLSISEFTPQPTSANENTKLVAQMRAQAEASNRSCDYSPDKSIDKAKGDRQPHNQSIINNL